MEKIKTTEEIGLPKLGEMRVSDGRTLPIYGPVGNGFLDTAEGCRLYNQYGPKSEEYQAAKAEFNRQRAVTENREKATQRINDAKEIDVFENQQFGQLRVSMQKGEPWFVAVDVCRVLEIENATHDKPAGGTERGRSGGSDAPGPA